MIRNTITPLTASALLALAIGCPNAAEKQVDEHAEARKEIAQAGQDAQRKVEDAQDDLVEAEKRYGQKLGDAEQEIADEAKEASKEVADADKAASDELMKARYERFEIIRDESETAFAARADAAIARLQLDLGTATQRSQAVKDQQLQTAVADAGKTLAEARTDLVELRSTTGKLFDDGRIGVGVAINRTQRALTRAYTQMAALKM